MLQPDRLTAGGFTDAAPHRAGLHAVYNQYLRCDADPLYTAGTEDLQALLRPLFITSWLIDDFLADNDFFGADTVLLSSASSKTAYGTAFQLKQRGGIEVVGLTSAANGPSASAWAATAACWPMKSSTLLGRRARCVYVDFAGNAASCAAPIHTRFAAAEVQLLHRRHACRAAAPRRRGATCPARAPTLFFAPAQVQEAQQRLGRGRLRRAHGAAWRGFVAKAHRPPRRPGSGCSTTTAAAAVQAAYARC